MNNQVLRRAAENVLCGGGNKPGWMRIQDVCRQWLADHSADETEPLADDWMRSVGFVQGNFPDDLILGPIVRGVIRNAQSPMNGKWYWSVRSYPIPEGHEPKTRGDLRRLCKSLGIPFVKKANA